MTTSAWLLLLILPSVQGQDDVKFFDCNLADYYGDLLVTAPDGTPAIKADVTRAELHALVSSTHRQVLPYTSSTKEDVWDALIDVDHGETADTVHLVYRQFDVPATPYGTSETWNREHLWPKSWGVGYEGPDFTDIHHLRPADWNVNSARGNKLFGACGIAEPLSECQSPAHPEAAEGTAKDSVVFLPPLANRGEVARAVSYMDLRYSGGGNNELDLVLTDCPDLKSDDNEDTEKTTLAYLSQILEWHMADPVTTREQVRNQRTCERWQGNRNVFVDFPELVEKVFGAPQTPLGDGLGYPGCPDPTSSPVENNNNNNIGEPTTDVEPSTSSPVTNTSEDSCAQLSPGDIMFIASYADAPEGVSMVALTDLPSGLKLYLTDNAWTGSAFRTNEGILSLKLPNTIYAGGTFGYRPTSDSSSLPHVNDWVSQAGRFQLADIGDTIFLYCLKADGLIHPISGLAYGLASWMEPNLPDDDYGSRNSALPASLTTTGSVALPQQSAYEYTGATIQGSKTELQDALADPTNWDAGGFSGVLPSFVVTVPATATGEFGAGDVMVVAMQADNPDLVALVALDEIPGDTQLFMTDNAWTGSAFRSNEGVVSLTVPSAGIPRGTVFGFGEGLLYGDEWQGESGKFALSADGDAIIVYMEEGGAIQHLGAFSNSVLGWAPKSDNESDFDTSSSALPDSLALVLGATIVDHYDNYIYTGPTAGLKGSLQASLTDPANWKGIDSGPITPPSGPFAVASLRVSDAGSTRMPRGDRIIRGWILLVVALHLYL